MTTKEKQTEKALVPKAEKAVVSWQGRNITVTFDDVKNRICTKATDQEVIVFLKMAQSLNLNPWAKEIYMVKYKDDEPASYIVAAEAYLKAAELCPEYDGHEAGVLIETDGELKTREGAFLLSKEQDKLVGGYAKVYRKDRQRPFYIAVNIKECAKYTRDGRITRFWSSMPATMIRKVALGRALREAFPTRLSGMISDAEYYEEIPEGTLPPAYVKNGKPDWKHFWAKVKSELGLTTEQARELLQVDSIKDELIDTGWTMEEIWNKLVASLQQRKATEKEPEQVEEEAPDDIYPDQKIIESPPEPPAAKTTEIMKSPEELTPDDITENDVPSLTSLLIQCNHFWKMQPADVCGELGYSSMLYLKEADISPWTAWLTIKEIKQQKRIMDPRDLTEEDFPDASMLITYAKSHFELKEPEMWKELSYTSLKNFQAAGIETPWECWKKLRDARI